MLERSDNVQEYQNNQWFCLNLVTPKAEIRQCLAIADRLASVTLETTRIAMI